MRCTTVHARKAGAATTLHDFVIRGAAEVGHCSGAQSFRAARRRDGGPVLLHKFRPAESLTALGPIIAGTAPDFSRPFVTQFTHLFVVAGSAYLVEPLPPCSGLGDVWRHILQKRPGQSLPVMTILIRQMLSIAHELLHQGKRHGALGPINIVLASTGCFGVLAAHLDCDGGRLWLRKAPESPILSDFHALVGVLGSLLDLDAEIAAVQRIPPQLPTDVRRGIRSLSHAMSRTGSSARSSVHS